MNKLHYNLSAIIIVLELLLGCWNNHVALYLKNDPDPLDVYPVQLDLLPTVDQMSLMLGIPVESSDELNRLLEDLLS